MEKLSNLPKAPKQLVVAKSEQDPAERLSQASLGPLGSSAGPPSPGA